MKLNPSLPLLFRAACVLTLAVIPACGKKADPLSEQMVHSQISRCGDATYLDYTDGRLKWSYAPGMELRAYLDVFQTYGDTTVFNFVRKWYDSIVSDDGTIQGYTPDRYGLDKICPGKPLFYLYDETGEEKYRKAIELVKSQIDGQPRTPSGAFCTAPSASRPRTMVEGSIP